MTTEQIQAMQQFIRDVAGDEYASIEAAQDPARKLVASWETESPKPTFQLGDKVRIVGHDYPGGGYETIAAYSSDLRRYALRYADGKAGDLAWHESDLERYED